MSQSKIKPTTSKQAENDLEQDDILEDINLSEFDEEIHKEYWFPYHGKYVAWAICMSTTFTCIVVLSIYGMTFGEMKSKKWLATVSISVLLSMFLLQPTKVLVYTLFAAFVLRAERKVTHKPLSYELFRNPYNVEKLLEVRYLRQLTASYYTPPSAIAIRERKLELLNTMEMRGIAVDLLQYILFMITLYLLIFYPRQNYAFYNNNALKMMVINGSLTDSINLMKVMSLEQFLEYLDKTLIPSILQNNTAIDKERRQAMREKMSLSEGKKRAPGGRAEESPAYDDSSQLNLKETPIMERAYTRDPQFKLLGKPRLRQRRVTQSKCKLVVTPHKKCSDVLSFYNEDKKTYDLGWRTFDPAEPAEDEQHSSPWKYRTAWENKAVPYIGRLRNFIFSSGGGYILELGKTVENSRILLDFMLFYNWIDSRTRVVIIEFATYSVNSNLFNVVVIMFEISASGVFVPSFRINTGSFFYQENVFMITVILFVFFATFLFLFVIRESLKMKRASLRAYFTEGWSILDFFIVIFGVLIIISEIYRVYFISFLLSQLDHSANNQFVSFEFVAVWDEIMNGVFGLLVCCATVKLFRLLTFRVVFWEWDQLLREAWRTIIGLFTILICASFAFSLFFYLILGYHAEEFSTIWSSFPIILLHGTRRHDESDVHFLNSVPLYLGVLFYASFVFFSSIILTAMFISVLSVHLRAHNKRTVRGKYQMMAYVKSLIQPDAEKPKAPPKTIPLPITLEKRESLVLPQYIDEIHMQGIKRETLKILTGQDYSEEIALNIVYIVLSGNTKRPATDGYNIVQDGSSLVTETTIKKMRDIANTEIEQRNAMLKNRVTVNT